MGKWTQVYDGLTSATRQMRSLGISIENHAIVNALNVNRKTNGRLFSLNSTYFYSKVIVIAYSTTSASSSSFRWQPESGSRPSHSSALSLQQSHSQSHRSSSRHRHHQCLENTLRSLVANQSIRASSKKQSTLGSAGIVLLSVVERLLSIVQYESQPCQIPLHSFAQRGHSINHQHLHMHHHLTTRTWLSQARIQLSEQS